MIAMKIFRRYRKMSSLKKLRESQDKIDAIANQLIKERDETVAWMEGHLDNMCKGGSSGKEIYDTAVKFTEDYQLINEGSQILMVLLCEDIKKEYLKK